MQAARRGCRSSNFAVFQLVVDFKSFLPASLSVAATITDPQGLNEPFLKPLLNNF